MDIAELIVGLLPVLLLALGFVVGHQCERSHLRKLDAREAQVTDIVRTNLRHIPANWQCSSAELVMGQAVIASDYFKTFAAAIRNLFGGEVRSLETLMARARREATLRMIEQARAQGANAVWNIRLETSTIGRGMGRKGMPMAEVFAYGTALHVETGL